MLDQLTTPDLTLLFLTVVVALMALVWLIWEIEQRIPKLHRQRDRSGNSRPTK